MKTTLILGATTVAGLVLIAGSLPTADAGSRGLTGPDVVASEVGGSTDFVYLGQSGGISAYSIGSTSCNIGDVIAEWHDEPNNAKNPVIAQHMYRMKNDGSQFEQIGLSWLKHSFCALSQSGDNCAGYLMPSCITGTNCDHLGIGCSDTYGSGLNDGRNGGPRWNINPVGVGTNGVHNDIYSSPSGPSAIRGRLQVKQSEIQSGYRYFSEIQYVTHDEAFPQRWNNATYREVNLSNTSISPVVNSYTTVRPNIGDPAIQAWQDNNPNVTMVAFEDDPNIGRFNLAYLVTDNGNGTWTYEYALHNLNSERAANRFMVPLAAGVNSSGVGFHDVAHHSNDGWNGVTSFDGTDWPMVVGASDMTWSCAGFTTDNNANALRWGTTYNFRFTADTPPVAGDITVGMYKGGGRDTVNVAVMVPDAPDDPVCPADIADSDSADPDGVVNVFDLLELLNNWGTGGPGAAISSDGGGAGVVDVFDLLDLLAAWGSCNP